MSNTGVNPHCQPCEKREHWIELLIRDEHNQPFNDVKGTLIDATQKAHPISLGEQPILVKDIAPGPVEIKLDLGDWLREAQDSQHAVNPDSDPVKDFSATYTGYNGGEVIYHEATTGDLTELPQYEPTDLPENRVTLPERHQKGAADKIKLVTDKTYILKVRAYKFITLRFGVFFDGTANNTYSALWGKQQFDRYYNTWKANYDTECEILAKQTGLDSSSIKPTQLPDSCFAYPEGVEGSTANEVTNVYKLYDRYKDRKLLSDSVFVLSEYITGIGTGNSKDIAPAGESTYGQATGTGDYGIRSKAIYASNQIKNSLKDAKEIITNHDEKIDGINKIQFDIFGFSRGAAAARHFINYVLKENKKGVYQDSPFVRGFKRACFHANLPIAFDFDWLESDHDKACMEITFAGLFDTVASVIDGLDTMDFSTHNTKHGLVELWIDPKRVRRAVHLTAHPDTEYRYDFSLNHLNNVALGELVSAEQRSKAEPPVTHFHEFVVPGSHSDIGGGYKSRLSYDHRDYLLPALEKVLVKSIRKSYSFSLGKKEKVKNEVVKLLDEYKEKDKKVGWRDEDYIIETKERIGKDSGQITGKLYIKRQVEGELSRLYLRIMYGLAEFYGVPVHDDDGIIWTQAESKLYTVSPINELGNSSFEFVELNNKALELSKCGDVSSLSSILESEALVKTLAYANLIHHSSKDSLGFRPHWDEESNCYRRASFVCTKEI
ncbi:T6SS phospholipase effector Tle1-like catalytic domain-containing protein [Salinivibrio sp. IB872]|uniref:T6SS phospholipase effector Tle1-like catalytic domain-containing protein n=1 Tax=Salinivibrio sp. IB872 TaxID=1766123 RepID=UPI0009872A41|nr:DUF2235 domain-containing protein [Salinivibrio sp. IB872]OOF21265.1 hypothetical protein BZJ18_16215 [Salinivibrio sp. IB872]